MALPGQGAVPNSGAIFNELTALTRRAFMPAVVVQLYFASPTLALLLGNAQKSAGGVNQITIPVQGNSMVQGAWTGYAGTFNKPAITPGVQNAQFSTSYYTVPVPIVFGESLLQSTEAVVPILDVRMNDVYATTNQQMGSAIFTNNTANSLMPSSFVDGFDNGTNVASYGGINRNSAGNSFWKGQYYDAGAANILTRQLLSKYLLRVTDTAGGESPDVVIMSPADFSALNSTFIGIEQVNPTPGNQYDMATPIRSGFPNININGIRFYSDHWCPKGTLYMINSKYTAMYLSEDAPFAFSGFYSTIPQYQIGQVGLMLVGYNIITSKPVANAVITNFTGADW